MKTLSIRALLFGIALALAATLVPPTASAASPNLFATVAANGTLVNGNGVSSVTHTIGTGQYEVTFASNVSSCAYVSTTRNAFSQAIQSYTAGGHLSASGVYVEVKNQGGGLTDGIPFHLAVVCPNAKSAKPLVVMANGLAKRGAGLTSAFDLSTGNYVFVTNLSLAACTMIGTRGSVDKSVPFTPATVEITPGPVSNSSGIQVRNLLFFGGGLINQTFHAAAIC